MWIQSECMQCFADLNNKRQLMSVVWGCYGVVWLGPWASWHETTRARVGQCKKDQQNSALAQLQCSLIEPDRNALLFSFEKISNCEGHGLPCSPDFIRAPWWTPSAAAPLQLETQKRLTISPGHTASYVFVHCVVSVLPLRCFCKACVCFTEIQVSSFQRYNIQSKETV